MDMVDPQHGKQAYPISTQQEAQYRIEDLQQIRLSSFQEQRSNALRLKEAQTQEWVEVTQTQAIIQMMMPYRKMRYVINQATHFF